MAPALPADAAAPAQRDGCRPVRPCRQRWNCRCRSYPTDIMPFDDDDRGQSGSRQSRGAQIVPERMTPPGRQLLISLIVACAMFMQSLDSTIIPTALPTIAASIGSTALQLNVAITCYLLSLAVFI